MKRAVYLTLLCLLFAYGANDARAEKKTTETKDAIGSVVVTYDLHRIQTHGTNQVAIWVEDASGKFINTLFVTRFTSKGGYIRRPSSLKKWVEKSDWKNATREEIDGLSSATPAAGSQKVVWNGKDKNGKTIKAGKYVICMEGNLRSGKMMYAKAEVMMGGKIQKSKAETTFEPEDGKSEPLFENVVVEYVP